MEVFLSSAGASSAAIRCGLQPESPIPAREIRYDCRHDQPIRLQLISGGAVVVRKTAQLIFPPGERDLDVEIVLDGARPGLGRLTIIMNAIAAGLPRDVMG